MAFLRSFEATAVNSWPLGRGASQWSFLHKRGRSRKCLGNTDVQDSLGQKKSVDPIVFTTLSRRVNLTSIIFLLKLISRLVSVRQRVNNGCFPEGPLNVLTLCCWFCCEIIPCLTVLSLTEAHAFVMGRSLAECPFNASRGWGKAGAGGWGGGVSSRCQQAVWGRCKLQDN